MKVAAAQFAVTNDVSANLATCLRIIAQAGEQQPDLMVLPEFCNHNSWYDNAEHCYQVSVDLDGDFLRAIAKAAAEVKAYLVINCTVRRANQQVTGTSLLYSPEGKLLAEANKQVLIGHENDFLQPAVEPSPIVDTPFGKIALYSCMDGVINETPRCLALRGAQLLCNSLNSFAIDEGNLHIPVRAAENKVFVVAANKVGPLIPEAMLEPVSAAVNIPVQFLSGAGDSQVVAPDGTVLALAGHDEEIIYAEIDLTQALDKRRPDGSDIFRERRPELYQSLGQDPAQQPLPAFEGPAVLKAAAISSQLSGEAALADLLQQVQQAQAQQIPLICLPELPWKASDASQDAHFSQQLLNALQQLLQGETLVATTLLLPADAGLSHCAVLIGAKGLIHQQAQVHHSQRFAGQVHGDAFRILPTPFGKLAVLCEDDAIYPETMRLVAMQGAEVVLVPLQLQERWLTDTGLVERAAENRVNLVAADHHSGHHLICDLQTDFTLMTPWKERAFDGLLSAPVIIRGQPGQPVLQAEIHPQAAANKVASHRTHLIANRPWRLLDPMIKATTPEGASA
ncbi:nitrilase-related carbon-nitrogen hydrolase [Alkalimonas sp. MEB108]|uniref:Nitrilase-related carbon-nitrogen hydrolase n=1 Tax=Alkalimonas cellulosilytica TaxID=3058395 RepID=A0ABU7J9F8_9GAMM|nr:nitrilase-related carbon-nitrogen hydrolase [Alkalimonas sp. MEB108]MEE2002957.1 nitrilase-related carbon-nitrogen hydrolase [Alkalimonas sp. MEB108]